MTPMLRAADISGNKSPNEPSVAKYRQTTIARTHTRNNLHISKHFKQIVYAKKNEKDQNKTPPN